MTLLGHTVHLLHHMGRNGGRQALQSICQLNEQMCRSLGRPVSQDQTQKTLKEGLQPAHIRHQHFTSVHTHFTLVSGFALVKDTFSTRGDSTVLIRWFVRGAL